MGWTYFQVLFAATLSYAFQARLTTLPLPISSLYLHFKFGPKSLDKMDLDGDSDDGLDLIWGEPEPKIELPQVPALPTRVVGLLLLLTAGLGGCVVQHINRIQNKHTNLSNRLQGIFALIFSNGSVGVSL